MKQIEMLNLCNKENLTDLPFKFFVRFLSMSDPLNILFFFYTVSFVYALFKGFLL